MRRQVQVAACMAIVLLSSKYGFAQETKVVGIIQASDPAAKKAAAYARYYINDYLRTDARYKVIDTEQALNSTKQQNAKKALEVAASMVQKGREAYDSLELDQAIGYLNNAIKKYERHVAYLDSPRPISEALIALGAAYILRGEERTGKKILTKAVLVDAMAKPDPRIFNPSMMEIFHDAQDEALNSPRGAVNVISNPSYSEVFMDGKFIGITPLSKGEIPGGRHYFRISKLGQGRYGKALNIHAHTEESLSGNLKPLPGADRLNSLCNKAVKEIGDDKVHPAQRELADFLKVDHLFIAEVKLDGEMVTITGAQFSIETGKRLKKAQTSFLFDPDQFEGFIMGFMNDNFGTESLYQKPATKEPPKEKDKTTVVPDTPKPPKGDTPGVVMDGGRRLKLKKALSIGLLGGGGGFAALGGIMWAVAKSKHTSFGDTEQTKAGDLETSGKGLAVTGDVLFFVGVAAAAAGAALLLFWDPTPSASDMAAEPTPGASITGASMAPIPGGGMFVLDGRF